jgi:Domain of unknown function (DUF4184)
MPFTLSHVAAVLLLRDRWKLIWPALIVGSMAPDFEYFMLGAPRTRVLHTFPGLLIYTVPLAFAVLWLTHEIMSAPFFEIMPAKVNARFTPRMIEFSKVRHFLLIVLSIVIGIATHIAWDAFTHEDTLITNRVAWEHSQLPVPGVGDRAVYKVLQWSSSILGLLLIVFFIYLWYRNTQPRRDVVQTFSPAQKLATWILILGGAISLAYFHLKSRFPEIPTNSRWMIVAIIVTAIAATFWEVLAFSVYRQIRIQWMIGKSPTSQRIQASASGKRKIGPQEES